MGTDARIAVALTKQEARWLAVAAQGLDRRPFRRQATKADLLAMIEALGCVQLDTISVISRSHETVLWSRLGPYDRALLDELYDPDHAITEYLAHAAAIVPTALLPVFRPYMERARDRGGWAAEPENACLMRRIVERLRADGPVGSRHFDRPEGAARAEAWDWWGVKPEREALARMWVRGDLVVRRRDGFQRVFDLPERIVPDLWCGPAMSEAAQRRELVSRAVRALGIATPTWTADYFRTGGPSHVGKKPAAAELSALATEGIVVPATMPGVNEPVWLDAILLPLLEELRAGRKRPVLTTLLSPFDSLVWHRGRAMDLFGFDYRLESYTPAHKRQYGYYTLPILHRGVIVGRLDPLYDRKRRLLTVRGLHLQPETRVSARLAIDLRAALADLAVFLGGEPDRITFALEPDDARVRELVASML